MKKGEEMKEEKPKNLTVNDLCNILENLANSHGCGDWEVKMEIGGVKAGVFTVSRYWSHEKGRKKFVLIE